MAISLGMLRQLVFVAKEHRLRRGSILIYGVQDTFGTHDDIEKETAFRTPLAQKKWSKSKFQRVQNEYYGENVSYAHSDNLFHSLGFRDIRTMDAFDNEEPTYIQNLNNPITKDLHSKFDVVLDIGTSEHVFNIGMAMENAMRMCKVGGHVVICMPMVLPGHDSFYNILPPFYYDLFGSNGFEEMQLYIAFPQKYGSRNESEKWYECGYSDNIRLNRVTKLTLGMFVARKSKETGEFVTPMQGSYNRYHSSGDSEYLDRFPQFVAKFIKILAPIYRAMPNWGRVLILDFVLTKRLKCL
jgi:hypothetical protein